ncbi:MAG: valine--tRNA ligase [Salinivirgaceae bacterium]|nr:valine--tRNA ligase [Salinivirgaceae bacterium]
MTEISSRYNPNETEDKWYKYWMDNGFFNSDPDHREPYCIVIPPPNVTGVLHMGHMLNNTIQDILVRRARMQGKNACWVPGTDHASIATEAKVVAKLKQEGIEKASLSRDEFLKHAWEWKEKHGGIILEQLKKLGASCDWRRTKFTMDEPMSQSVLKTFVDLHNKGLVYRGVRMVNWDPQAQTAVSDEEVIHRELQSKLYYLQYFLEDDPKQSITIATTRPETILGDTAICVNPNDDRFKHLVGKKALVPLINRPIPIIEDEYVDMEFGTGALKITPAHDINDYSIGIRHNLDSIDIFNPNGTLNEKAILYIGKDRFAVRDEIVADLQKSGNLVKTENYINKVGFSERTDAVIEPKLSMQWFLNMKELGKPALDVVMNDEVKFHPAKLKNTYKHWMENIQDWCISRQLWWGQRIPVFYLPNSNEYVVALTAEEALVLAKEKTGNNNLNISDLRQDDDVLDTWFSSWLWPISVFDGINNPNNEEINYYYPTNDLVTAPEIMFFWVARMIMAGLEYRNAIPFSNVYYTGIVRDQQRRKMSKSLGNSPDPIELMKIYGADGVRVGMLLCSPAGNDLLFDESLPEQGRNFGNKIWNAFRLVKSWNVDSNIEQPLAAKQGIDWFNNKLSETILQIDDHFTNYRINDALMSVYKLFWDDFASWYLEIVKPAFGQGIDQTTLDCTIAIFDKMMRLLHPFMPFITEEIWQEITPRKEGESLMISTLPKAEAVNESLIKSFDLHKEIISAIRTVRKEKNIPYKQELTAFIKLADSDVYLDFGAVVQRLTNLTEFSTTLEKPEASAVQMIHNHELYVPVSGFIDTEAEIKKLEAELDYTKGFLNTVMKKLNNEKFVNSAPEMVVSAERKKQADAEARITIIEEQLKEMRK